MSWLVTTWWKRRSKDTMVGMLVVEWQEGFQGRRGKKQMMRG